MEVKFLVYFWQIKYVILVINRFYLFLNLDIISFIKCDLAKENLTNNNEQMNEFCKDKGFVGWFETSAKDDINVEQASKFLVSKV